MGPLFHLLAKARGGKANEIFGAFGLAFEDYANGILRSMYPDRSGLASRLRCPVAGRDREGRDFEMDAVLNDVLQNEAVLDDFEKWLEQIRSRYGVAAVGTDGKKERTKGVAQLAQLVRRVLDSNCGAAQPDFADVEVIYPVLLVHDTRLNAPAYGTVLAGEFLSLLGSVPTGKQSRILHRPVQLAAIANGLHRRAPGRSRVPAQLHGGRSSLCGHAQARGAAYGKL